MPAVMAKYDLFAEKAGMRKVAEQSPSKEALKIAEILQMLGFSLRLLASESYNLAKLRSLSLGSIRLIKKVLSQYNHPRFMKYFTCDQPFGKKPIYSQKVLDADIETLAHLIKVCGFLLQTKVYLFWEKGGKGDVMQSSELC